MYFRVLGPLSVGRDDSAQAFGALMIRRLLAALLCRPNRCVSVDELMSALWGADPPASARGTLQVYIRRLRIALADEERIASEPSGYRIVVRPGELDAAEFSGLVDQAVKAAGERASELLTEALGLWRGPAYADVREHSPLADEARRLDEERLRVESWHCRLRLELGRHAELVPHLSTLIEIYPYSEDLRGHLMLALYRCGRQSEALEIYRRTAMLLIDELGVEPGPELRRLHEAILRADASLDPAQSPRSAVPRQLPADISGFAGRVAHLEKLDGMLTDPSPIIISTVEGGGGIGKTTLAVHWAHAVADEFPDGHLYVNLRGFDPTDLPVAPDEAIRSFLEALGVPLQSIPTGSEAQAALYRSLLAGKRMLVVLDNVRDADHARALLPGSPTCRVVITSRMKLASLVATNGARGLMLNVLTDAEARELLAYRLGQDRLRAEPGPVDDIIVQCARLPLALAIAAARAATEPDLPLATIAAQLRDARKRLDALEEQDAATDLRAVFSWSYRCLGAPAARLFRLLGLHPGPDIGIPAAASLAGLPVDDVAAMLGELADASLITEHASGRYTFHDLLRAYATELAQTSDSEHDRQEAIGRMLDHYLHTAVLADWLLDPARERLTLGRPHTGVTPEQVTDHDEAMAWFAAEHHVIIAAVQHIRGDRFDRQLCQLTRSMFTFLDRRGHWQTQLAVQHVAIEAGTRLADPAVLAFTHSIVGATYTRLGQYDQAIEHRQRSLAFHREAGNHSGEGFAHMGLGWALQLAGHVGEAVEHTESALSKFRIAGHQVGEAMALTMLGWNLSNLGDYERALKHCQEALPRLRECGDRPGEADAWHNIGNAQLKLGRLREALTAYEHAISLYTDLGHRHYEALVLGQIGDTHEAGGDLESARSAWRQALVIYTELGLPDAETMRSKLGGQ